MLLSESPASGGVVPGDRVCQELASPLAADFDGVRGLGFYGSEFSTLESWGEFGSG